MQPIRAHIALANRRAVIATEPFKKCTVCHKKKDRKDFSRMSRTWDGLRTYCKKCGQRSSTAYYKKTAVEQREYKKRYLSIPEKKAAAVKRALAWKLKNECGTTIEMVESLRGCVGGICIICTRHESKTHRKLVIDHCHEKKIIRGLICDDCNRGLGSFKDSIWRLRRAVRYLEDFEKWSQ